MTRRSQMVVVAAFAVWLTVPLVLAAFGVGSNFSELEERHLTALPAWSVDRLIDSELYKDLARAFGDRVPLRVSALSLDAWIDLAVFGDSPNPDVLIGRDGWLFDRWSVVGVGEATTVPQDEVATTPRDIVSQLTEMSRILDASGRRLIVLIVPDKESIYPELLGPIDSVAKTSRAWRQELQAAFADANLPGYIDGWQAMEALKARSDEDIYWPNDTHWTSGGALEATRQIVDRLDPTLWDESAVKSRPGGHHGDLAKLIGLPTWIESTEYWLKRNVRVKIVAQEKSRRRMVALNKRTRRFMPQVLSIHDSFGARYLSMLPQYLAKSTWISWIRGIPDGKLVSIVDEFARADVIILESVERLLASRLPGNTGYLPAHLLGTLFDDLPRIELGPVGGSQSDRIDLPPAESDTSRYFVFDIGPTVKEATVLGIRTDVMVGDMTWTKAAVHVVRSSDGGRRVVARLPADAVAVKIRPSKFEVDVVSLVDV